MPVLHHYRHRIKVNDTDKRMQGIYTQIVIILTNGVQSSYFHPPGLELKFNENDLS